MMGIMLFLACGFVRAWGNGHALGIASPCRYAPSNSLERWASMRRTSRRWPFTRAIFIES